MNDRGRFCRDSRSGATRWFCTWAVLACPALVLVGCGSEADRPDRWAERDGGADAGQTGGHSGTGGVSGGGGSLGGTGGDPGAGGTSGTGGDQGTGGTAGGGGTGSTAGGGGVEDGGGSDAGAAGLGGGTSGAGGDGGDAGVGGQGGSAGSGGNPDPISHSGSNYAWYDLNGCNREPYGIVYNYHVARSTVQAQLQTMYDNGQRRLRIPIYFCHGCATGTVMDSTGGNLSAQHRANLADFLADVHAKGFEEVMVGFFPQAANHPASWSSWSEALFQENWNLIVNLRPIIAAAGIQYRIDLMNEGSPPSSLTQLREYCRKLWTNYEYTYGKNDTVGFSIPPGADSSDLQDRIQNIPYIYGGSFPYLYSLHFYNSPHASFLTANSAMNALSPSQTQGWIVGETYYNDRPTAEALRSAITQTGRTVYYLTQWPITTQWACPDVDVTPPSEIGEYQALGF